MEKKGYARPYEAEICLVVKIGVSFSSKMGLIEA